MVVQPGSREETVETIELRLVVSEYDELEIISEQRPLTPQEQKSFDELHAALLLEEEEYWRGASPLAVDVLRDATEIDFPMIRYTLGLLNHQFNN
jgi:hypothetical protein